MRLDAIVVDCRHAAPLARFWAAALGWSVASYDRAELARLASTGIDDPEDDPSVMVEPPEGTDLPVLFFVEAPAPEMAKSRLHLDLRAEDDLETEVRRLEELGARIRGWEEAEGGLWCVMLDPEGNEYCVMPPDDEVA